MIYTKFSGGEVSVNTAAAAMRFSVPSRPTRAIHPVYHLRSSDDVMAMLLYTDARRREAPGIEIHATIPYVPYARQDRVMQPGEANGACVMAKLINSAKFTTVTIWDPHSDVITALLDNVIVRTQFDILDANNMLSSKIALVSPDAGASKKINEVAKINNNLVVHATKNRDVRTGVISKTCINVEELLATGEKDLLIVDDICDGGATFVALASELRSAMPTTLDSKRRINLYVTHGIFSKGVEAVLADGLIDNIFVANSWLSKEALKDLPVKVLEW